MVDILRRFLWLIFLVAFVALGVYAGILKIRHNRAKAEIEILKVQVVVAEARRLDVISWQTLRVIYRVFRRCPEQRGGAGQLDPAQLVSASQGECPPQPWRLGGRHFNKGGVVELVDTPTGGERWLNEDSTPH